jgi:hypothetical protein
MKRLSILKKIKLFNQFKKSQSKIKYELETNFGIRIDYARRMYTVLNIPPDLIGDAFSLRKSDIDSISEKFIKEYTTELSKYLTSNGLSELYDFYKIQKVDKYSYLLVLGFSVFKSYKYYNILYYIIYPVISISIISSLLYIFL